MGVYPVAAFGQSGARPLQRCSPWRRQYIFRREHLAAPVRADREADASLAGAESQKKRYFAFILHLHRAGAKKKRMAMIGEGIGAIETLAARHLQAWRSRSTLLRPDSAVVGPGLPVLRGVS